MGHDDDGRAVCLDLPQLLEALRLKVCVAHAENLVDEQHVSIHVDRHGKGEAHIHAGGVGADGVVNEFLQLGEIDDGLQALVDFFLVQSENRRIGVDVLPAAHVRMESGAQLDEAGNPSLDLDRAAVGVENAGQELQGGTFAAAVVPDQSHRFAALDGERDAPQHVAHLVTAAVPEEQPFLEALSLVQIDLEVFGDVVNDNDVFVFCHNYNSSANPFFSLPNTSMPRIKNSTPSTTASRRLARLGTCPL